MVKKLRINESKEDRLFNVMNSRVVRNKLDEFRDMYYNQGIYEEEFNGRIFPHEITDVRCTIDDVWTDVLGNSGIWDIICHVDIQWDYDENTDTVGTQEYFSFYYDPVTDTIVDEKDIHTMEQDFVPLTDDSLYKTESYKRKNIKESNQQFDTEFLNLNESPYPNGSTGDLAHRIVQALGVEEPYGESTDELITELEEFFGIDFGFSDEDRFLEWDEVSDEIFSQLADQPKKKLLKYAKILDDYGYRV